MKKQKGFTLIELVVVMVILGILAAYAIPKFYDFRSAANIAIVNGLAGAINSASVTAHGAALALNQNGSTGTITMEGSSVALVYGYPNGASGGIGNAVNISSAFTANYAGATSAATFQVSGATTPANCVVTYTPATSSAAASVSTTTSGC